MARRNDCIVDIEDFVFAGNTIEVEDNADNALFRDNYVKNANKDYDKNYDKNYEKNYEKSYNNKPSLSVKTDNKSPHDNINIEQLSYHIEDNNQEKSDTNRTTNHEIDIEKIEEIEEVQDSNTNKRFEERKRSELSEKSKKSLNIGYTEKIDVINHNHENINDEHDLNSFNTTNNNEMNKANGKNIENKNIENKNIEKKNIEKKNIENNPESSEELLNLPFAQLTRICKTVSPGYRISKEAVFSLSKSTALFAIYFAAAAQQTAITKHRKIFTPMDARETLEVLGFPHIDNTLEKSVDINAEISLNTEDMEET